MMDRRTLMLSALGASAFGVSSFGPFSASPAWAREPSALGSGALGPGALGSGAHGLGGLRAEAVRTAPDRVRLSWQANRGAFRVFASSDPDAPTELMRLLAARVRSGQFDASFDAEPRPYFVIESQEGHRVRVAERLLPLEGGRNFRDLGGYHAEDGRMVRWGRIYRSGVMTGLTARDLVYLAELGIESVCDLRSVDERAREPAPFKGPEAPSLAAFDYGMDQTMSSMASMFSAQTRDDAVAAFSASYVEMADFLTPHYKDMFARLLRRETPLAMNCSAGKDRTGLAAAFVLSVLGVPRDTVIADYALSEIYVPPEKYIADMREPGAHSSSGVPSALADVFARMPTPVLRVLLGTDADVMRRTLAKIDADFGGPVELAKARYGLDEASVAYLRSTYLV